MTLVRLLASVHQHVSLQFRIIQEPLSAVFVRALKELVSVYRIVLFQTGSVVEHFAARLKRTLENFGRCVTCSPSCSSPDHPVRPLLEHRHLSRLQFFSLWILKFTRVSNHQSEVVPNSCQFAHVDVWILIDGFLNLEWHSVSDVNSSYSQLLLQLFRQTEISNLLKLAWELIFKSIIAVEPAGHSHTKEIWILRCVRDIQQIVAFGCQILKWLEIVD